MSKLQVGTAYASQMHPENNIFTEMLSVLVSARRPTSEAASARSFRQLGLHTTDVTPYGKVVRVTASVLVRYAALRT